MTKVEEKHQLEPMKDDLVDIQIGDGMGQDAFMSIETNSVKDDIIAIILFLIVIFATTAAGIFGPPKDINGWSQSSFGKSGSNSIHQTLTNLSPMNQFLLMSLEFHHSVATKYLSIPVSFSYTLTFRHSGSEIRRQQGVFNISANFTVGTDTSNSFNFFNDRFLKYDEATINIDFIEVTDLLDSVLIWKHGDPNHSLFQAWIRFIYSLASLSVSLLFIYRLFLVSRLSWCLEQKLTILLHIFAILGANPFYILFVFKPSMFQASINSLIFQLFVCYSNFFMLIILDNLKLKDRRDRGYFFLPKIALFIIQLIVESITTILLENTSSFSTTSTYILFKQLRQIITSIYIIWFIFLILKTFKVIDQTEKHKFYIYTIVFSITLLLSLGEPYYDLISFLSGTSGSFAIHFSSLHAFVILMAFFHWPFESSIDQQYNDADGDKNQINSFEPEIDENQVISKNNIIDE